jgi:photosystem II stability/assembly factor-like uncharacterized protein
MPEKNCLGIHGVENFMVVVGERGKIIHFAGDLYEAREMESPTTAHLNAVYVVSERCAWAVGEQGAVLRWDGTHHRADRAHRPGRRERLPAGQ